MNDPHNRMYSHDLRVLSELSGLLVLLSPEEKTAGKHK